MVSVCVFFKSHVYRKFIAFSLAQASELLDELDSSNIDTIIINPNYRNYNI